MSIKTRLCSGSMLIYQRVYVFSMFFFMCFSYVCSTRINRTKLLPISSLASSGPSPQVCLQSMTWETYRKPIRQVVQEHPENDGWCTSIPGIFKAKAVCGASIVGVSLETSSLSVKAMMNGPPYGTYESPMVFIGNLQNLQILGDLHVGKLYENDT